eukprot:1391898-Amphidinium_carterae.2
MLIILPLMMVGAVAMGTAIQEVVASYIHASMLHIALSVMCPCWAMLRQGNGIGMISLMTIIVNLAVSIVL